VPLTSVAVARLLASPSPDPFSADQGGRNRHTGTCAALCRREAAPGSRKPRNRGTSVVQLGPWNNSAAGPELGQFQTQLGHCQNQLGQPLGQHPIPHENRLTSEQKENIIPSHRNGPMGMTVNPQPEPDRLEAATDEAIAACGIEARDAVRALIVANEFWKRWWQNCGPVCRKLRARLPPWQVQDLHGETCLRSHILSHCRSSPAVTASQLANRPNASIQMPL
jgi:hypothetical protein